MSDNVPVADDDLSEMLGQRAPRKRAKTTTVLLVLLILVLGMILGVPLGRMSAQIGQAISEGGGQQDDFQRPPPGVEGD